MRVHDYWQPSDWPLLILELQQQTLQMARIASSGPLLSIINQWIEPISNNYPSQSIFVSPLSLHNICPQFLNVWYLPAITYNQAAWQQQATSTASSLEWVQELACTLTHLQINSSNWTPQLGRSVALKFAKTYPVALLARNPANYESIVKEINQAGGKAIGISTDVSSPEAVENAFAEIKKEFQGKKLAAAIYNVGGRFVRKPFLEMTLEEYEAGYESNGWDGPLLNLPRCS